MTHPAAPLVVLICTGETVAPGRVRGQLTKRAGRDFPLARKVENIMSR